MPGQQGRRGKRGPAGEQGKKGRVGSKGVSGDSGLLGFQGPPGPPVSLKTFIPFYFMAHCAISSGEIMTLHPTFWLNVLAKLSQQF